MDYITVYPGHLAGTSNNILADFSKRLGQVFRDRFVPDLLVRHSNALKSQHQGPNRNIIEQLNTIHVNPSHKGKKLAGKSVLVLDDFTTYGYSFETARQMLLCAGASNVTGVAIAKYRTKAAFVHIKNKWDAFSPHHFEAEDVDVNQLNGILNAPADSYFYTQIWENFSK